MATLERDPDLVKLTDKALSERIKAAGKTLDAIEREDSAKVVREGRQEALLNRYDSALSLMTAAVAERDARRAELPEKRRVAALKERFESALGRAPTSSDRFNPKTGRWEESPKPTPAQTALKWVSNHLSPAAYPEIVGEHFDATRLNESEGTELYALTSTMDEEMLGRGPGHTDEERKRFEVLVGKSAGDEGLFERKRRDAEAHEQLADRKETRRLMSLPPQPELAEPGSVRLPEAVFSWLRQVVGDRRKMAGFTIADVGVLWTVLAMLENRQSLLSRPRSGNVARVEEVDGEPVLVVAGGIRNFRFPGSINPDENYTGVGAGRIKERDALETLARGEWLVVEEAQGEAHIRAGKRVKKLREGGNVKATTAS
jgi:hypothetical protein